MTGNRARQISVLLAAVTLATAGCGSAVHAPGHADAAGRAGKACPVTQAKSLPKSSPWWRNGWLSAQNKALSERIADDQSYLTQGGIQLTQWGPDPRSGKTKIYLTHYTPAAARGLYARYGCAVVVATTSEPRSSIGGTPAPG
jgi:hypothetical protein